MAGFLTVILLLMVSQLATSARLVKLRATLNDNNKRRSDEVQHNESSVWDSHAAELEFSIRKPNACTPGLFRRLSLDECEQAAKKQGKGGPQEETDAAKPAGCYVPLQPSAIPSRHLDFRYNHHEVGSADSYSFPVCTSGEAIDKEASRVVDSGCGTEAWEQAWETAFMTGLRDKCPEYKFQSAGLGDGSPVCAAACELIAEIAAKLGVQLLGCTAQGRGCYAYQRANSDGSIYDEQTGCVYDDPTKAAEALKPIMDTLTKCFTDNAADPDADKLKKCQCDRVDAVIKFHQAAADDCSGAFQTSAKASVEAAKKAKEGLECSASIS